MTNPNTYSSLIAKPILIIVLMFFFSFTCFSTVPPGTHGTENMLDDNIMASFEDHGENYKMEDKRETSKDNLTKGLYQSAEVIEGGRTTDNTRPPNENNNNYYANNNAPKPEDAPADSKLEVIPLQLLYLLLITLVYTTFGIHKSMSIL